MALFKMKYYFYAMFYKYSYYWYLLVDLELQLLYNRGNLFIT